MKSAVAHQKVYSIKNHLESERHTEGCIAHLSERAFKVYAFEQRHPKFCRKCGGTGMHVYYDDPGAKDCSLSGGFMYDSEPCSECIERDVCPQCGGDLNWDESIYTSECKCGYKMVEGEAVEGTFEYRPDPGECYCWEFLYDISEVEA